VRLTNNSGRSREQILELSGSKPSSIFESHCEKGCSLSMWLTGSRILNTKNCVLIGITENGEFSEENWTGLDTDRRNICRGILTDYTYVLVKEMVSPMHETATSHLAGSICAAIIRQLHLTLVKCLMKHFDCTDPEVGPRLSLSLADSRIKVREVRRGA
jgi:hypothetical protein